MKLKNTFKYLGLILFFCALVLCLLSQNAKVDQLSLAILVGFGCVLALSGACLVTSELLGKIDDLERRTFYLEEELKKMKREKEE
ncbi:MAG: hypothetical protein IJB19_03735 [Clostridia bacterium]|nr:hypothetical protein [Clostridia bacterium]